MTGAHRALKGFYKSFCFYAGRDWGLYGHDRLFNYRAHERRFARLSKRAQQTMPDKLTEAQYRKFTNLHRTNYRWWRELHPMNPANFMFGWPGV